MMLITFIGYAFGYFILPTLVIIAVAAYWKSNRRPYTILRWFFWIMVGMMVLKLSVLLPLIIENAMKQRTVN